MRLSAIRLAGFKSFVDKTQLTLTSNLTAVVGPNGCGKSNLIDAVRWVLGESSAKQLRGAALSDVIFNGSRTRKPVGRAMIELVFDNSDATIEGPYAQYGEIAVRRELSRDGGSQFYINGTRCRRKDITELFLGTGLGGRSNYAIIEQGTVSRLIEAQPEELRQMLEESAGISRYKEKRRETEIRIRHTRENLDRLEDLLGEIDERLSKLQRQAAAAQRFKQYKQDQRRLRRQLLGLRWRELETEHAAARERLQTCQQQLDQAEERLKDAIVARKQTADAAEQSNQETQAVQARYYEAEAALGRAEQELKHAQEMIRLRDKEAQDLRSESERLLAQFKERDERGRELGAQLTVLQQTLADAQQELATLESGLAQAEQHAADEQRALETLRDALQKPRTVAATEKVRLEQLGRQLERTQARATQCEQDLAAIDVSEVEQQITAAEQAMQAASAALEDADVRAAQAVQQVEQARRERGDSDAALHEARKQAQSVHARLAALTAEQARALGDDDKSDTRWLADKGWSQAQPLARVMRVQPGWEDAAEAVLGPWLQAPCIDGQLALISDDEAQPARLIELDDASWQAPEGSLAAQVEGPLAIRKLLATVFTAASPAAAQTQLATLAAGHSVVTAQGHMLWPGLSHRRKGQQADGVLLRERLLAEARDENSAAQQAAEQAHQQQQAAVEQLKQSEHAQQQALQALDQARRQHAEARSVSQRLSEKKSTLEQRRQQRSEELAEVGKLLDELRRDRDQAEKLLEASRGELEALEQQERAQLEKSDAARKALQDARHRQQDLQRQLDSSRERRAALSSELAAAQAARDALDARRKDVEQNLAASQQNQDSIQTPLPALQDAVAAASKAREAATEALKTSRQTQELSVSKAREAAAAVHQCEQASQNVRARLQEMQLGEQRLLARRDGLEEQVREAGARLDDIIAELDESMQARACEEELEKLDSRIQRLGAVNLAAVEEYDEEKQRADHLRAQEADLVEALDKLEDAIRQIDKETRARFRATFESVNDRFKARFPKLFGGGEAYLELTGEDVLDAGVRVMARPPGKRNATIQLLSGGEKAMTAVALVFALFELNPAPFCMLDEVDAPLDDANVVRYCEVVREMSEQVQFIIVTHNKVTMELADQLNGVTMQEPGVSRLVSVDVQQAVALAG